MIAPGKVIVAKADEQKPKFTIDGASAPADIAELLARLIPLYPSNKTISYDAIFGLPTPVKIGQSWPVHADAMAEHWKHLGYLFKAEDVSGQVKADSLEQYNNEPCIKFEADYYISQFVKEPTTLPTQYKVDSSSRRGHLEWMMPVSTKPIQEFSSVNTITDNTDGKFKGRRYSMTEVTKLAYDSRIVPQQMPTTKEE